ncbi:MAG: hypothetical protein MJE77_08785 [Proteobacteria bacterium]|nr:hypothetical protein [Pseudomonadota bacterium]
MNLASSKRPAPVNSPQRLIRDLFAELREFHTSGYDDQIWATVTQVDDTQFPNISVYFSAVDEQGQFVFGLSEDDVILYEGGRRAAVTKFHGR